MAAELCVQHVGQELLTQTISLLLAQMPFANLGLFHHSANPASSQGVLGELE
jgi:hypothetical protein